MALEHSYISHFLIWAAKDVISHWKCASEVYHYLCTSLSYFDCNCCYVFVALKEAMQRKDIQILKKLYIQLDNANNNKGWTVIIGLSVLVALGICDKIVVAYLPQYGCKPHHFLRNNLPKRNGHPDS